MMVATYKAQKQMNNKHGEHNFGMEVKNTRTSNCMIEVREQL
jgi:hypothetical protein